MADTASTTEELNRAMRNLSSASGDYSGSMNSAASSVSNGAEALREIGSGAINFGKQLSSGTDGLSKYSGAVSQMSDGLGDLITTIGKGSPFAIVLGLFTKAVGAVVGKVLEHDDKLLNSYDKLAEFGAAAGFTTASLQEAADTAGYPVSNGSFQKLTETMSSMSTDMLGLGSTASDGVKKFLDIAKVSQPVKNQFNKLGISQQKLNEMQASYVKQQVRLGVAQSKNAALLQKESLTYATNLVELAAVTGKTTDQIKKSQEDDLNDVAYAIHSRKLAQTKEGQAQLEREKKILEMAGTFGEESRTAVRKVIATGTLTGEEASNLGNAMAIGGDDLVTMVKAGQKGSIDEEKFRMRIQDGMNKRDKATGNAALLMDANSLQAMAQTTDTMRGQNQIVKEGTAKSVKNQIAAAKNREDTIKDGQSSLNEASTALGLAFDKFIALISGAVHTAFKALMYGFTAFTKGLVKLLDNPLFKYGAGVKLDQSVTNLFLSTDELTKRNVEITAELKKVKESEKESFVQTLVRDPAALSLPGKKASLTEEQKAIQKVLADRLATETSNRASSAAPASPVASAPTQTNPAPVGPSASGAAPPPIPTQGSHEKGGIAREPFSGFSGPLGGTEATIPLPSGENIPAKIKMPGDMTSKRDSLLGSTDGIQSLLSQYASNLTGPAASSTTTSTSAASSGSTDNIFELVASKMDELLDKMKQNNLLQTEILQQSKR